MKLLLGLAALMLATGLATLWLWRRSPEPVPCESRDLARARSPDGRSEADLFELRCDGAVTTHVALRSSMSPPKSRADVFVAAGSVPVDVAWSGERELVVQSPPARVVVSETRWRDVAVKLRPRQ